MMELATPTALRRLALSLLLMGAALPLAPRDAQAGGQGTNLPPPPLPVRATELRVQLQARMVCVDDPSVRCDAPYLDSGTDATTTAGGTFRSASCPGSPLPGACRPDTIPGAELSGELVVDWPITRTPPDPDPAPGINCGPEEYKICGIGSIELNVTAPGVVVPNPLVSLDSATLPGTDCECIDPEFDDEAQFGGELIEEWWITRNIGATCDIALEYARVLLPRDQIRAIGQQAFPSLLCVPDDMGQCTFTPEPVFVEPDGSLTKGCGTEPDGSFVIRFAQPNEPLTFVTKPLPETPRALADVNGDDALDLVTLQDDGFPNPTVRSQINDGTNAFTPLPSGIPPFIPAFGLSLAAGDVDFDGNVDLVVSDTASGVSQTRVYPGDGTGFFSAATSTLLASAFAAELCVEELNGDAYPEVVGGSRIYWNQNGGPISPAIEDLAPFDPQALGDVDGDTATDLIAHDGFSPGTFEWASNGGPGSFAVQALVATPDASELLGQTLSEAVFCPTSDCCSPNDSTGCEDTPCETAVCAQDSFCCNTEWDDSCADQAASLCSVCSSAGIFGVTCSVDVGDVAADDVDADGDGDLLASFDLTQRLLDFGGAQNYTAASRWIAWLPNLQVDDPGASGGNPLFDPQVETWRVVGRAPAVRDEFESDTNGPSVIEIADIDGDGDNDLLAVGMWYRNDAGSFRGPFALRGELTRPPEPDVLFAADTDDDGDLDVVVVDTLYEQLPTSECSNGKDDDGDGFVDFPADPACKSPDFVGGEDRECQNGINDDGQPGTDFDGGASWNNGVPIDQPDPQCKTPWRKSEAPISNCGLGSELALLLAPLFWLRVRRRARGPA